MAHGPPPLDLARLEVLLPRYETAGPRYTSYPTAPTWTEEFGPEAFREALGRIESGAELSVYVHVPFCRSLCHFCACNRVITRDPERPARWLDRVQREIRSVRRLLPERLRVSQIHWGGGTPTHLSPEQIEALFGSLAESFPPGADAEISIEVDPRVTTREHLLALERCGMNRISLGVQDIDPRVQQAIHRIQPAEQTAALVDAARERGFLSVGFDLIYGLPFQTEASFDRTLDAVLAMRPDRIALYAYAHVTWVAKQQRGFERKDLPSPPRRLAIFLLALRRLLEAGYRHIGMDHFALPEDSLSRALDEGTLRRNFMGYTTHAGAELVAFGPSAISEVSACFAQSHRDLEAWGRAVEEQGLATFRGHALSRDDRERGFAISGIMCRGELSAADFEARFGSPLRERFAEELARLEPMERDGLVRVEPDGSVILEPPGRLLVRNVAMVFDAYLPRQREGERPLFSRTV